MTEELGTSEGLTRREALKKGAMLGGALVWAVPVVQTVGMSSAMAATVSEGTCCLRISMTDPVVVGDTVSFSWTVQNCGSEPIDNVTGIIEESTDGGATWLSVVTDNKGLRAAGSASVVTSEDRVLGAGSYTYRIHGEFDCLTAVDLWHTIPGGGPNTYIQKGPVVVV